MSQVTEQSVRFQTALASITLIQASAVLDLTEDDSDFLTSNKVWIATDRSRARRCVEACVYGTLDFVGYPRFPAPVEFFFSSRRRHTRWNCDWSSDVCSSDLMSSYWTLDMIPLTVASLRSIMFWAFWVRISLAATSPMALSI